MAMDLLESASLACRLLSVMFFAAAGLLTLDKTVAARARHQDQSGCAGGGSEGEGEVGGRGSRGSGIPGCSSLCD